jgi:hypothetical protein
MTLPCTLVFRGKFKGKVRIPMTMPALENIVKVGSKIQALRTFEFADGSWHIKGEVFDVTEEDLSYFRLFTDNKHNYKLLQENTNRNN